MMIRRFVQLPLQTLLLVLAVTPAEGRQPLSLASVQSRSVGQLRGGHQHKAKDPHEAAWFGGFGQMESTSDADGTDAYLGQNPTRALQYGFQFGYSMPLKDNEIKDHTWFHESPSGGEAAAWQTHYPAVDGSVAGNRNVKQNPWRETPEGWVQDYNPSYLTEKRGGKPGRYQAEWFDSSVLNYDGFGRKQLPYPESPRRSLDTGYANEAWVERAVNTTVACASIGCTANSTLKAFDATTEEAQNCRLNIGVHPTDYDDDWGQEKIEQWTVNGYLVKAMCDPKARGCNVSAARPLYSCLSEMGVDHILDDTGSLLVTGTINPLVDECPYEGNLLSAVAVVTCLVRPIPVPVLVAAAPAQNETVQPQVATVATASVGLGCATPGCNASSIVNIDPTIAMLGGSCLMNISVVQTDFDDNLGMPEELDFLAVEGLDNLTLSQPNQNPCTLEYQGTPISESDKTVMVVTNANVTAALLAAPAGSFTVKGKISDQVDECASNGKLLDAMIQVKCELPQEVLQEVSSNASAAETATASAAEADTAATASDAPAAEEAPAAAAPDASAEAAPEAPEAGTAA